MTWLQPMSIAAIAVILTGLGYIIWRRSNVLIIIGVVTVAVFIIQFASIFIGEGDNPSLDPVATELGFDTSHFLNGQDLYTIFTYMFVHANLMHLLFNIFGLFFIGMMFEQKAGPTRTAILYIVSGMLACLLCVAIERGRPVIYVGASAAIFGLLAGAARTFPDAQVRAFFILPPMPLWVVAAAFIFLEFVWMITGSSGFCYAPAGMENIGHLGHIGGALFGALLAPWVMALDLDDKVVPSESGRKRVRTDMKVLERIAITGEQKELLEKIRKEDEPDIIRAWTEHLLEKARCPDCGRRLRPDTEKHTIKCKCGLKFKY